MPLDVECSGAISADYYCAAPALITRDIPQYSLLHACVFSSDLDTLAIAQLSRGKVLTAYRLAAQ